MFSSLKKMITMGIEENVIGIFNNVHSNCYEKHQ